jgi:hypothetical protein
MDNLTVIISGGFSLAYHKILPAFERLTGTVVTTLSGASQEAARRLSSTSLRPAPTSMSSSCPRKVSAN